MNNHREERVLTKEEVDALVQAMKESTRGSSSQSRRVAEKKIAKYDVRKPDRIAKDQIRSLHLIHDYFQRSLSSSLSAYLRAFVELKMISIEQLTYGEFLECLSEPTCYTSISMNPMEGNMVLEVSYPVVFPMIDLLLGGNGTAPREGRPITDIEWAIMEGVIKLIMNDLREAWKPVVDLDMHLVGRESNPQLLQFVSLSEPVVAISFELRIGNHSGSLNIGIPSILLKLIRHRFEQQSMRRRKEDVTRDMERINVLIPSIPVDLEVEMRGNTIRMKDFLSLSVGDIVGLQHPLERPMLVAVQGIPRFTGQVIRYKDRRGVLIEGKPSELDMQPQ